MKTVFIFQTPRGFGKGWSLQDAIGEYAKANGKFHWTPEARCSVLVFKAKSLDDVGVDQLNWHTENGAEFLASG